MAWTRAWHHQGRCLATRLAAGAVPCASAQCGPSPSAPSTCAHCESRDDSSSRTARRWHPWRARESLPYAASATYCADFAPAAASAAPASSPDETAAPAAASAASSPAAAPRATGLVRRLSKRVSDHFRNRSGVPESASAIEPAQVHLESSADILRAGLAAEITTKGYVKAKGVERVKLRISRADVIRNCRRFSASFEQAYEVGPSLGSGGFGQVVRVTHRHTGVRRAMKQVSKASIRDWNIFISEVENLIELDHPHIIKLIEFYEEDNNAKMVFELCTGPDLLDRVDEIRSEPDRKLPITEVAVLLRQMIRAVLGCHSHGITHSDIKPEHFMVMEKEKQGVHSSLKLINLGLSEHYRRRRTAENHSQHVAVPYTAPEVLNGSYDNRCDVWSLGVIFYLMLTSEPLFSLLEADTSVIADIMDEEYVPKKLSSLDIDDDARDLLTRMLTRDPGERIKIDAALKHPFFKNAVRKEFDPEFFQKMVAFTRMPYLKRIALLQVAHLSKDRETELQRRTFRRINTNGDGELSKKELHAFMIKHLGVELPKQKQEVLHQVACEIDSKGKGCIHYFEFLAATLPRRLYLQESFMRMCFDLLDANADGYVDVQDLRQFCNNRMTAQELSAVIGQVDRTGTGRIAYTAFCAMMHSQ